MRIPVTFVLLLVAVHSAAAEEDLSLATAGPPAPNSADEPLAESYSLAAATRFLDQASLNWTSRRKCFTCHTNYSYLIARPAVSPANTAHRELRAALERLVEQRWKVKGPRWDAEVVMSAAVLALNDRCTSGKLHPTTRKALDRMWAVQREDGGFDWMHGRRPPLESDDDYGAAMAAVAAGAAPGDYRSSEAARAGLAKLRSYFEKNAAPTVHHEAMMIWADSYLGDFIKEDQRDATIEKLLALQKKDGGWALATLGNWQRADNKEQDTESSDGYATGFVIYVLRRGGLPADHPKVKQGVAWLKANQRVSGRWFTRSLSRDNKHFISHAGTAFAVLALVSCDAAGAE
jgi:squalene-hopene/tetraprenyl-beta-curcumene cyclase